MWKKIVIATVVIYFMWFAMDFCIHNILLSSLYMQTANLWRPQEEMMIWLIQIAVLIAAFCLTRIYALYFKTHNLPTSLACGVLFGLAYGVSAGYGMYAV